jgi:phosphatidylserine/phosphatidylglycerophosphate/cardiolipin synthase-like enzyme
MPTFAEGKIEVYVGPRELDAEHDLEAVIVAFIEGAVETLDIAIQELDSKVIAQAILDARWRGVNVRMFVEQDYLRTDQTALIAVVPKAGESEAQARERMQWGDDEDELGPNREIFSALLRSDIEIHGDFNKKIFHQKFVLRDFRGKSLPTSALLTGSANFTTTDTHKNLNHVFVFNDHRICREYRREVEELQRGSFGRNAHGPVPRTIGLAGVPVKVLFAPDHTPELELIKQMLRAKKRVEFAIFTFSGSSGIDDAMAILVAAGRRVRGVMDAGQGRQWWSAMKWLSGEKIEVFLPRRDSGVRKLHHKLMVIDDATVVAGSMNYTSPANEYNDENLFVVGSPYDMEEDVVVDHDECAAIAGYMRGEVERIIADLSAPYTEAAEHGPASAGEA